MRCVVTGKTGQIVTALIEAGQRRGVNIIALGRPELDLAHPGSIAAAISRSQPDIVINAAAYTAVDKAESDQAMAMAINATGAGAVAAAAAQLSIPIIHLSTDYVFSGDKAGAYLETDETDPRSVYGHTKLAGEKLVASSNPRHATVRTSWVFAPYGQNFLRTMLRLAETKTSIGVVGDQRGSPTYAPDIAEALLDMAIALLRDETRIDCYGVFHMTGSGQTSWAEFAERIFEASAKRGGTVAAIKTITTAEYPTTAHRPANSSMDGAKLRDTYGVILPDWQNAVDRCLDRLVGDKLFGRAK
jgi:dTDP-4-dehydrorhamnose reductase